jgi:energy-coupling factor transport system ATP-binding protein
MKTQSLPSSSMHVRHQLQISTRKQHCIAASATMNSFGSAVRVSNLSYHPPGSDVPLLRNINLNLASNSLGLIIGRSGSGKTTLLQCLAGLIEQTEGRVVIGSDGSSMSERMSKVGIVWQFPERHFLGETVAEELSFAWPPGETRWKAASVTQQILAMVGLSAIPLHLSPTALSGGQQRRLALAVQLARRPQLLLLDEPLAGLDWQSRSEVASLLAQLKKQCTLLVVSHDLKEIGSLVDKRFEMSLGGFLASE